jgi:hypothetical protein
VTVLTNVGCQYVILVFASRVCTVVTANAISGNGRMIKISGHPSHGCVAIVAIVPAADMRRVFADRNGAFMTGRADTDNLRVINRYGRLEKRRAVAIFTDVARQNMILILTDRIYPVMATDAIVGVIRMIKSCRYPGICRMTGIAIFTACDMCRVLADGNRIVMT